MNNDFNKDIKVSVDYSGLKCPLPVLKARRVMKDLTSGDKVQIITGSGFFRGSGDALVSQNFPRGDANSVLLNVEGHTRHDVTNDYNLWSGHRPL